ncbi:MAG: site-specific recombinase [Actinomycetota bacterium]|nr:site-specific recombinase [Actinomycetota bacterium]
MNRITGSEIPTWLGSSQPSEEHPQVVRAAFAARVSTDDQQDPTLSLPRQLASCQKSLPDGMVIVAHFFDIESGRTVLDLRGQGHAHDKFDIPIHRDGSIDDLLAEAQRPDRRFDVVICESVDRIARITYYGTKIEHELEQVGVLLLASDEPFTTTRHRATAVLTRRMKQGIAEWYVLDMLEKAWGGFEIHTHQGWNVGQPPYGYIADSVPHPVPARRAEGKHKTRLIIDPVRAATVQTIYDLRIGARLGYRQIAHHLNADLTTYPPPTPTNPDRAVGRWTPSSVREILHNPKYTGYMVWNRRASKKGGRMNPITDWVLSDAPTHPAIITPEQFAAAEAVASSRERSRSGTTLNAHPQTRHSYALRSFVFCALCGRRMSGKTHNQRPHYVCYPKNGQRPTGHPVSIIVREEPLLTFLGTFFNTHLLGPDRAEHLAATIRDQVPGPAPDHTHRLAALNQQIADLAGKQQRLLHQAENGDPSDPFTAGLRNRYNDLDIQRRKLEQERCSIGLPVSGPAPSTAQDLLSCLPIATLDLTRMPPDILRDLCEAFRIRITFDRTTRQIHFSAQVEATAIPQQRHILSAPNVRICDVPPAGLEPALERF